MATETEEVTEAVGIGPLLEVKPAQAAEMVCDLVSAQSAWHSYKCAVWERNRLAVKGYRNCRIVENPVTGLTEARVPKGTLNSSPSPSNLAKALRRVVSQITVDAPVPDVFPTSGDQKDADIAELSKRLLMADAGDNSTNHLRSLRTALSFASIYGSGFEHYYWDDKAGGLEARALECDPNCWSIAVTDELGQPVIDENGEVMVDVELAKVNPLTGQPDPSGNTVIRYVMEDGFTLSDSAAGAERVWRGEVVRESLTGKTLWMLPVDCLNIDEAEGVVIGRVTTLGELESSYPDIDGGWTDEVRAEVASWRPDGVSSWLDPKLADALKESAKSGKPIRNEDGVLDPETPVFCYRLYRKSSSVYPGGALVVTVGNRLLFRGPWEFENGAGVMESMELPVAQMKWRLDPVEPDYYGTSGAEDLVSAENVIQSISDLWVEYVHKFGRPRTYVPVGTPISARQLNRSDNAIIPVNMDGGGRPIFEHIPDFPAQALMLRAELIKESNSDVGLEDAARGVASPSVKSGTHAERVIEQAMVALAETHQNARAFCSRMYRILLQQWRVFVRDDRLTRVTGVGGEYKQERWNGADLTGLTDIGVARGSLTMQSPSAKQGVAREEFQIGMSVGDPMAYSRYQATARTSLDPVLGMQDDVHRNRAERQIDAWWRGPSEQTQAEQAQYEEQLPALQMQYQQMVQQAQAMQQEAPPFEAMFPSPIQQASAELWKPLPVDAEPSVAQIRWLALREVVPSPKVASMAPDWQIGLFQAYDAARQAAGIQTVAEQAQSAQMAQQAEVQGEMAKDGAKIDKETEQKLALKQADAAINAQEAERQMAASAAAALMPRF